MILGDVQFFFADFHHGHCFFLFADVQRCALVTASDPDLRVAYTVFPPSAPASRAFNWQVLLVLVVSGANIIPAQVTIARTGRARRLVTRCTSTSDATARAKDGA